MMRGAIERTFEYYDRLLTLQCVEVRIHFTFTPGCEAQTSGPAELCYPAEPAEWEFDYAERERQPFEVRPTDFPGMQQDWVRLLDGEWLEGWCRDVLCYTEECDLIEALPDRGPDEDDR